MFVINAAAISLTKLNLLIKKPMNGVEEKKNLLREQDLL